MAFEWNRRNAQRIADGHMRVHGFKSIVDTSRGRVAGQKDILPLIDQAHGGTTILVHMCRIAPQSISRHGLMAAAGYLSGRSGHAHAAFEFWILRINDTLPLIGWRIAEISGFYHLEIVQ